MAGPSLETADVLATAAFVAGHAWADVLRSVPGYAALAITSDGALRPSVGWPGGTGPDAPPGGG